MEKAEKGNEGEQVKTGEENTEQERNMSHTGRKEKIREGTRRGAGVVRSSGKHENEDRKAEHEERTERDTK